MVLAKFEIPVGAARKPSHKINMIISTSLLDEKHGIQVYMNGSCVLLYPTPCQTRRLNIMRFIIGQYGNSINSLRLTCNIFHVIWPTPPAEARFRAYIIYNY